MNDLSPERLRRAAWLLIAIEALLLYCVVVRPAEQRIVATRTRAHDLYALAQRRRRTVEGLQTTLALRRRVRAELERYVRMRRLGSEATIVRALQREGALHAVVVSEIVPDRVGDGAASSEREIVIGLQGRYRDVLASIVDLPHHTPLEVGAVALQALPGNQPGIPRIEASIHARAFQSLAALLKGGHHDASSTH